MYELIRSAMATKRVGIIDLSNASGVAPEVIREAVNWNRIIAYEDEAKLERALDIRR